MTLGTARIKVFLLAENRLLREALARVFAKKPDITVAGACAFTPLVVEQITAAGPDLLLLDSFTTALSHLEFIREIQRCVPGLKVVMIGMDADENAFVRAVREGAVGYVLKDASALEVVASVRSVANGEAVCPPQLSLALFRCVAQQVSHVPNLWVKKSLGFTVREQQLVSLIGRGLTNKKIAAQLQLSEQTVRNHVHRMLRKVGASDRLAVVELCRQQGLAV
jgi:DNA-binding NarL/FixJ family response regulator